MVVARATLFAALVACSSGKPHAVEDAKHPTPAGDAPRADAPAAGSAVTTPPPKATTGDVQIRVEWTKVPAEVRASPGTTPCGTPRQPQVSPSTTWGIGDAVVLLDGGPPPPAAASVRLADCALVPRVAIGGAVVVDSAMDRPAQLVLSRRLTATDLRAKAEESSKLTVQLPVAGHAAQIALEPGAVYLLAPEGKDVESAWIVAASATITDGNGVALIKDVAPGVHAVRAWLPPRAGRPARHASGSVTVTAGDLADLTLQLEP